MPDKLALEFYQLDVGVIEFPCNLRAPVLLKKSKFLAEIYFVHCFLLSDSDIVPLTYLENCSIDDRHNKPNVLDGLRAFFRSFREKCHAALLHQAAGLTLTGCQLRLHDESDDVCWFTELEVRNVCGQLSLRELLDKCSFGLLGCRGIVKLGDDLTSQASLDNHRIQRTIRHLATEFIQFGLWDIRQCLKVAHHHMVGQRHEL